MPEPLIDTFPPTLIETQKDANKIRHDHVVSTRMSYMVAPKLWEHYIASSLVYWSYPEGMGQRYNQSTVWRERIQIGLQQLVIEE